MNHPFFLSNSVTFLILPFPVPIPVHLPSMWASLGLLDPCQCCKFVATSFFSLPRRRISGEVKPHVSLENKVPNKWGDPRNKGQGWDKILRERKRKKRKNIFSQSVDAKWNYFDRFSSPILKGPEFLISFTLRHEISPMTWQTVTSTMLSGSLEACCHPAKAPLQYFAGLILPNYSLFLGFSLFWHIFLC